MMLDSAVIDRIRGYADDGMSPARIAATLGVSEAHVAGVLVGRPRPEPPSSPAPSKASAPVSKPSAPRPGEPPDREAQQDEAWRLVHDLGGYQVDVARDLGIPQAGLQDRLRRHMRAHGIEGPLPGTMTPEEIARRRDERRGKAQKGANNMTAPASSPTDATTPLAPAVLGDLPSTDHAVAGIGVVIPGADHAETIPAPIPEPSPATDAPVTNTHQTVVISASDPAPTEAELRARYAALLIRKAEANGAPSYDRLDRVLGVRDVDAWEAGRREGILQAIEAVSGVWFSGQSELIAKLCRAALRPDR